MEKEIKIVLIKFSIITTAILAYVFIIAFVVSPTIIQQVFGQSAFDTPNQFNQPQFNQYQDPYNQQYQQPYQQQYDPYQSQYQQYGTPTYSPYAMQQQYGYPQQQNPIQFGTSEIIYTLLGGAGIGYGRYNQQKRNQDKEVQRELMAALLQEKQEKRELARVSYAKMPQQGNEIVDAPSIQLQKLDKDIDAFADKVAKA